MKDVRGKDAPNYREKVGVSRVHKWLDEQYGQPKTCEGKDCRGISIIYDWALKTGMEYKRDRGNFFRLCRSCHKRYDLPVDYKERLGKIGSWNRNKKRNKKAIHYEKNREKILEYKRIRYQQKYEK